MNRAAKFNAFFRIDGAVRRERLLERMMRGAPETANTTILVAPAGYGKTTLLAQLAAQLNRDGVLTAWLNCDPQDRQPNVFLRSLNRAYSLVAGAAKKTISDLLTADAAPEHRVAVFIDDYEAASSAETDLLLKDLACSLGENVCLYIGCRDMTSTCLTELALQGIARLVDASELRFNAAETRLLFPGQVDDCALSRIHGITDGWAVVLQLIRLGMPHDAGQAWLGEDERMLPADKIFSYLATEIWDRLPDPLREFMESTAPLRHIDVASANWLRASTDSAKFISLLRDLHPIVSVDSRALEARLHPLLRDFLMHRLSCRDASVLPALHGKAAGYFESRGDTFDAVAHALQSDDATLAIRIIERAGALRLAVSEGMWHVKNLLSLLPKEMVHAHPRIRLMEICATTVEDNPAENRFLLDHLEAGLVAAGDAGEASPAWIDMRYARCVEMLGQGERIIAYAPRAALESLKEDAMSRINQDPRLLGMVLIVELLLVQRSDDTLKAELRTDALGRLNHRFKLTANNVWHPIYEAQNDYHAGRLESAEHRLRGLLTKEFDMFRRQQSAFGPMTNALLGRVHFARGELEEAMTCFERIPDDHISPFLEVSEGAIVCRAFCDTALGRPEAALERLHRELLRARELQRPTCACLINATRVELLCRTSSPDEAAALYQELLQELHAAGITNPLSHGDIPWCLRQAMSRASFYLAMSSRQAASARSIAMDLQQAARLQRRVISEIMAGVLHSDALSVLGKSQAAIETLAESLALCRLPPPAQFFLEYQAPLPAILGTIATNGGRGAAAAAVVMRVWEREFADSIASLGLLSRRECEVIVRLMQGHATKKIARDLVVSPETVKFHLKSIYTKLGVNSRHAAAREAHRRVSIRRSSGLARVFETTDDAFAVGDEAED